MTPVGAQNHELAELIDTLTARVDALETRALQAEEDSYGQRAKQSGEIADLVVTVDNLAGALGSTQKAIGNRLDAIEKAAAKKVTAKAGS